jgi:hypothetical protein
MTTDNAGMAVVASHLADTSALARLRHPPVAAVPGSLNEAGGWQLAPLR